MASAQGEAFSFQIGDFRCTAMRDAMEHNRNILLVETGQQRILIDTGGGRDPGVTPSTLLDRMARHGVAPGTIDMVVLSHADFDHIGGAIDAGAPAFPNARHLLHRKEAEFWAAHPDRLPANPAYGEEFRHRGNTLPVMRLEQLHDRLELVDDGAEPVPGLTIVAAPGHTPGYAVIALASREEHLMCIGDLVYDPANVADPDWHAVYDYDPPAVIATRRRVFERAYASSALLMAYHLPFPGLGRLSPAARGWTWHAA